MDRQDVCLERARKRDGKSEKERGTSLRSKKLAEGEKLSALLGSAFSMVYEQEDTLISKAFTQELQ